MPLEKNVSSSKVSCWCPVQTSVSCCISSPMRIIGIDLTTMWHMPSYSVGNFQYVTSPKTNFHYLTKPLIGQTSILADELLDFCDILRSCAGQGPPHVVVVIKWCSTSLESCVLFKYPCPIKNCLPNTFLNLCKGFCCSLSKICTVWCKLAVPFF